MKRSIGVPLSLAALVLAGSLWLPAARPAAQTPDAPVVARVTVRDDAELTRLLALGLDLLETREGDDLFLLTTPKTVAELRAAGWRVAIDEARSRPFAAASRPEILRAATFQDGYRTVAEIRSQLQASAAAAPALAEFFPFGQSWESVSSQGQKGSALFGLKLTNKAIAGPKPTFFLMAAIHARELVTTEIAARFVSYLLDNYGLDGDVTWLLDNNQIVVVPVVNPDGRAIAEQGYYQRKNTNNTYGGRCDTPPMIGNQAGVDLNRNYLFQWGLVNTPAEPLCGETWPGPVAASEPETQAIQTLVRSLFPDQRGPNDTDPAPHDATGLLITLHSYAGLVLWPWGATRTKAPNAADLEAIGRKFAAYNGLTAEQSVGLYPTSGTTDDWSYGELGIASYTFEIGPNTGPCAGFFAPYRCLDGETGGNFWARNLPALLYAARLARAPYDLIRGPSPELLTATPAPDGRVEIHAEFAASTAGAQNVAAVELYLDTPPSRGGAPLLMNPADGHFDSPAETATLTLSPPGPHTLYLVRARDAAGNTGPLRGAYLSRTIASGRGRLRR